MLVAQIRSWLSFVITILLLASVVQAQSSPTQTAHTSSTQATATALASLPEADTLVYASPQKLLNETAPKVLSASDLSSLRDGFAGLKKAAGIDPSTIDYIAIAFRFRKPTADLSFVPPDVLAVLSGDFSADSLVSLAGVYLQDRARTEKYGSKTLTIMKIDPIAELADKSPLLKPFVEISVVALNSNTIAVGNVDYVKSAVDAAEGNGRINQAVLNSVLRDPNALVSVAGSPLTAFAKSFGMLGTQTTPRESNCNSHFGDFYAAITSGGSNFNLRGAMNADNPDTAKIINGLLSGVITPVIDSVSDKDAQAVMKGLKLTPQGNEIIIEADVTQQAIANLIREQMQPKKEATVTPPKRVRKTRRRVHRK